VSSDRLSLARPRGLDSGFLEAKNTQQRSTCTETSYANQFSRGEGQCSFQRGSKLEATSEGVSSLNSRRSPVSVLGTKGPVDLFELTQQDFT